MDISGRRPRSTSHGKLSSHIDCTGAFIAFSSLLRSFSHLPPAQITAQSQSPLPPSALGLLPPEISEDFIVQEIDSCWEQQPGMVPMNTQIMFLYTSLARVLYSE